MPVYSEYGVYPDQIYLPVWDLLKAVTELSKVFSHRMPINEAETFNKYVAMGNNTRKHYDSLP